jgi:hypothetical protein
MAADGATDTDAIVTTHTALHKGETRLLRRVVDLVDAATGSSISAVTADESNHTIMHVRAGEYGSLRMLKALRSISQHVRLRGRHAVSDGEEQITITLPTEHEVWNEARDEAASFRAARWLARLSTLFAAVAAGVYFGERGV